MGGRLASSSLISLAQLATDTGGRFTDKTNDFSLGYARAQRDLTCLYTLGFYLRDVAEDRVENVAVAVRVPGLRAFHPGKYTFRSEQVRRTSLLKAAWFAPEQFQTGVVQAHVFPLRPASRREWEALVVVGFPIPAEQLAAGVQVREFGAVLYDGPRIAHRFNRRLTVRPENLDQPGVPRVIFLDRARLAPGRYALHVVLADGDTPHAAKVTIEVPELPRRELFLVGPILARRAGAGLVVLGDEDGPDRPGSADSFQPLLVQSVAEGRDVLALTQACLIGKRRPPDELRVDRSLERRDGEAVGTLAAVELSLDGKEPVRCQTLLDLLPAAALDTGEYAFAAALVAGEKREDDGSVRFAVGR